MRVGVVSDTHNNLKNCGKIVELFNKLGVERVIHTGDITQPKTLEIFSELESPLYGVFGNNDVGELEELKISASKNSFHFVSPPLELEWAENSIVVVHDPLELNGLDLSKYHLVLHGHTHRETIIKKGNQLTFNPGECAGHMTGLNNIGVVDLEQLSAEIIKF